MKKLSYKEIAAVSSYVIGFSVLLGSLPFAAHGVSHLMPSTALSISAYEWREWATLGLLMTFALPALMGKRFLPAPFVAMVLVLLVSAIVTTPLIGFVAIKVLLLKFGSCALIMTFIAYSISLENESVSSESHNHK